MNGSDKRYVTYEEFGAVGDGVADDMAAIVACHAYANEHGLSVRACDGAQYYIGGRDICAEIKTDVEWGSARFVIDDTALDNHQQVCFSVVSDDVWHSVSVPSLCSGQKTVDFAHTGTVLLVVEDESRRVYIRKGLNQNNGCPASDIFVVESDGTVIGDINWDYARFTSAKMRAADDRPITIHGGIFTTVANKGPCSYRYHNRNINISRSHVTLTGLTHYVTGEGDDGAPYNGFLTVSEAYDVTLSHCLLTPHKTYRTASKIPGKDVPMGTYDIILYKTVGVTLFDIQQTIDITDGRYWGLMGSNFCKNFAMRDCKISRFDAHMGVTNGEIHDCELGHMGANLIGFGNFLVEDTVFRCRQVINLRDDYGSFFNGRVTLKNCTWIPTGNLSAMPTVIKAINDGSHDFGYACAMPAEIVIENLLIDDADVPPDAVEAYAVFPVYDSEFAPDKPYPYGTPKQVTVSARVASGKKLIPLAAPALYPHLQELCIKEIDKTKG